MGEPDSVQEEVLRKEALAWFARTAMGEATAADMEALRRWRDTSPAHAAALAQAGRLWRGMESASEALVRGKVVTLPTATSAGKSLPRRSFLFGAGAAAAAAAVGAVMVVQPPLHLWPSLAEFGADHRTATGERRQLNFDSVSVAMNTRTSIAAHTVDGAPGIELIAGEVAVTVVLAATPFVVTAGNGRIVMHQGAFDLRREGTRVDLTCIDGDATIECGQQTRALGAAKWTFYDARGLGETVAADPEVAAWRDGMLVFHDTPLSRVIDEVNRYRSGKIILLDTALGRRTVTARFELDRLETVILQIRHVFNAPVRSLPGGIVLVG